MHTRLAKRIGFLLSVVVFLSAAPLCAQQANLSETSYLRAREVLEAGRKALGAGEQLPGIQDLSWKVTGKFYARNQSPLPTATEALPLEGQLTVDFANNRLAWEVRTEFPGVFPLWNQIFVKGDQGTVALPVPKNVGPLPGAAATRDVIYNRIPQALLGRAFERAATLRWIGEADFEGKKQNVIAFATANGAQISLYFDAKTNLLTKYETLGTDPVAGDAVTEVINLGYQTVGGFLLPTGQLQKIAGETAQDYRYSEVRVNTRPPDERFQPPTGFAPLPAPRTDPPAVRELAKDVYVVEGLDNGGYAVMFVAFNDHAVVFEPVLNEATSRIVMAKVKETLPGKPIRAVVATHHHSDHIGGVRTYFADGIPLITTPGNVAYFQKMASARFTLAADSLQRQPRKPSIDIIQNKKRVLTDGDHTVELYDIGPVAHVQEFVIVWLPKERVLFGGDAFGRTPDGRLLPANATTQRFADAVASLGLSVEKLVDVHSTNNTAEDLQQAIALSKKAN